MVGLKVVVLFILLSFTMPTANTIMMQGSESGIIILDANGQYCSSMAIDAGSILLGSFSTNGSLVEFFVIHETFFVEYGENNRNLMLTYGYSSAADFELSIPSDGSWYWVFINNTNSTIQVTFSWRSIRPFNIMTPQNLYLAMCGMPGVLGLAIISYIIRKRRSATAELQKKEEV